jgi:hypothetical protein
MIKREAGQLFGRGGLSLPMLAGNPDDPGQLRRTRMRQVWQGSRKRMWQPFSQAENSNAEF